MARNCNNLDRSSAPGDEDHCQGVQGRKVLLVNCFRFFFGFIVAIFDLLHNVEAIHGLCSLSMLT